MQPALAPAEQSPLELQFEALQHRFPGATLRSAGESTVISIPDVRIPAGWSSERASIHFLIPAGYPHANPDCFSTDAALRLADGAMPASAGLQDFPIVGQALWFSWHLQRPWKPGRDTLLTWVGVCLRRFEALA
jgi:hypothetical protein